MFQTWHTRRCYERTRGQLFCALHFKALKRRDISGKHTSDADGGDEANADLGKVVNLMQCVIPVLGVGSDCSKLLGGMHMLLPNGFGSSPEYLQLRSGWPLLLYFSIG